MDNNKISLVFDGSILANGVTKNASRSGIYFTVYNIFKELLKRENIAITLYCDSDKFGDLKTVLKTDFPEYNFKIITNSALTGYENLKKKKECYKKENRPFMKFMVQMLCLFSSPIYKLAKLFSEKECIKSINENDVYFSLIFKKPKGVNIKSFIMLYDLIPQLFPEYNSQFQKGLWFYDLCKSLNNKDYYLAISEQTKQDFLKYYPVIDENKIFTTLLACNETFKPYEQKDVDRIKAKYNIPQNKKYVFSLCTLEPRKNLIRAVKTFIKFIKKNKIDDLVFVLGGGHWEIFIGKLEQEIANLKDYSDKIIKIGYVDDEDLPILYSGAEWFTYTSMYEGFGLPPLEAMSCGCPVITSNNSSLPEVVGDAGIMIDYDGDEQHIHAYEKYYFDKELRNNNAQKGIERAKQFSWEKCADEIMEIIGNEI